MKQLTVQRIVINDPQHLHEQEHVLNSLSKQLIEEVPWQAYPYKPAVQFVIGYNESYLFLKYFVTEKAIRAVNNKVNSTVWEDSCVEFFIGFNDTGYYNFEFNCIGTSLAGYGPSKTQRKLLPEPVVEQITTRTLMKRFPGNKTVQWELTVSIPLTTFMHHQPLTLSGRKCRGNFYKCGDLLPEPHFVTWSGIQAATPNFHMPAYFGQLHFE